jgi:hypothetical protein
MTKADASTTTIFHDIHPFVQLTTLRHYVDRATAPLVIGRDRWSFVDIAQRTGLPPGRAARIVSALATEHAAASIRDFYRKSSPSSVAVHGFGERGFLLLLRVFQSEGLDVVSWARRGPYWRRNGRDNFSSFYAYKHREQRANDRARVEERRQRPAGYAHPALATEGTPHVTTTPD